jgi:hypothetical protein
MEDRPLAQNPAVDLGGGWQLNVDLLIEIEGVDRPACAAQALFRHYQGHDCGHLPQRP